MGIEHRTVSRGRDEAASPATTASRGRSVRGQGRAVAIRVVRVVDRRSVVVVDARQAAKVVVAVTLVKRGDSYSNLLANYRLYENTKRPNSD